ncbi:MAG: hypothetical protein K2W94_01460 [Alphaproteobacteria bacterium]|nr:hypothetical protein [Alphaproteobacteria bacterium]
MKLFTKVTAAALLSTAISAASMAAPIDVNDAATIADKAKIGTALAAVKVATTDDINYNVTIHPDLVDSLEAMPNGKRFTGSGGQVEHLMDALKAIYADLYASAGGGAAELKTQLGKLTSPLTATFNLDLTEVAGKWDQAVNTKARATLKAAVVDDPFKGFDESALKLDKAKVAGMAAKGGTKYHTIQDAIDAYAGAKKAYATSKDAKDLDAAKEALAELKAMKVTTKAGDKTVAEVLAFEAKADWTTPEVRKVKNDAVAGLVKITPDQQVAIDFYQALNEAFEGGQFAALKALPEAKGLNFDDATTAHAGKAEAKQIVALLVAASKQARGFITQIAQLKQELADAKAGSSGAIGGGGHIPSRPSTPTSDHSRIANGITAALAHENPRNFDFDKGTFDTDVGTGFSIADAVKTFGL